MKKINFCKATTIILIINVILSIVLFFVVPDNIAIQWVGTTPSNAVDSYYIFLVPILSVLFAFAGKPIFTMFLFRLWNRTNEHLVTYLNLCLQVVFLTCEIYIGLYNLCNFNFAISIILIVELMEELQQIPEVKEIYATERTAAIIEYHDEQLEIPIIPITPDNQEEILKTLPVDWTYETLVKQDAMVILGTSVQKEVYHACPSIGEKVTLRWFDGAEHSIDVLIAGTSEKSMNEGFYLPKETIEKLWGDMDLTASLTLSVPEYEKVGKSVESKLNKILSRHPDLVMETLQEVKASSANTIHNTSVQVYGVSAFVIILT